MLDLCGHSLVAFLHLSVSPKAHQPLVYLHGCILKSWHKYYFLENCNGMRMLVALECINWRTESLMLICSVLNLLQTVRTPSPPSDDQWGTFLVNFIISETPSVSAAGGGSFVCHPVNSN